MFSTAHAAIVVASLVAVMTASPAAASLVPSSPAPGFNYWTTWYVQNYPAQVPKGFPAMGDRQLFGNASAPCPGCGWAHTFYPIARSDVFLLLDASWSEGTTFADQFFLDPAKFPEEWAAVGGRAKGNWTGAMRTLSDRVKAAGWAGLGVWHHALDIPSAQQLQVQLDHIVHAGGLSYLKIDGTDFSGVVTAAAPADLTVEHKRSPGGPVNGNYSDPADGRLSAGDTALLANLANRTDVLRTDDIVCSLSIPTCLDRMVKVQQLLERTGGPAIPGASAVIAPQDEAYLAVGFGASTAAMRFDLPQLPDDPQVNGDRLLGNRTTELARAVRWQRIAPPVGAFDAGAGRTLTSSSVLVDSSDLNANTTWFQPLWNKRAYQSSFAVTSRGLPTLPAVVPENATAPRILAHRHPNGAVAVSSVGRNVASLGGWVMPRAAVSVAAGPLPAKPVPVALNSTVAVVACFGHFSNVTVTFSDHLPASAHVLAQDLAGFRVHDVTSSVTMLPNGFVVPGSVIDTIGTEANPEDDISSPGVVFVIV